jgi:hypothetical protein
MQKETTANVAHLKTGGEQPARRLPHSYLEVCRRGRAIAAGGRIIEARLNDKGRET